MKACTYADGHPAFSSMRGRIDFRDCSEEPGPLGDEGPEDDHRQERSRSLRGCHVGGDDAQQVRTDIVRRAPMLPSPKSRCPLEVGGGQDEEAVLVQWHQVVVFGQDHTVQLQVDREDNTTITQIGNLGPTFWAENYTKMFEKPSPGRPIN